MMRPRRPLPVRSLRPRDTGARPVPTVHLRPGDLRPGDQVFTFVDPDGGEWLFNASHGYRLIDAAPPREVLEFHPADHKIDLAHIKTRYPDIDLERARLVDPAVPILFVPFGEETRDGATFHLLVDGWHRLARCVMEGRPSLPCLLLTRAERDAIVLSRPPAKFRKA